MSAKGRQYRLSPLAEIDLENIWFYTFQNWSPKQADRYQNEIMTVIAKLAEGTKIGRPIDVRPDYFKYPAGSHFIFYRQSASNLDVIRILHQSMDAPAHL